MKFWRRDRSYVHYRALHESIVDRLDLLYRLLTGQFDLPPYSLRNLSGGARGFREVGPWFLNEFKRLGLFREGHRILDVGCGCGRVARALATDTDLRKLKVSYVGVDIDQKAIRWCCDHLTSKNSRFKFYHVDLHNRSDNPGGQHQAMPYHFPYGNRSFDLIIVTSVFTHLLEKELENYLQETHRLLATEGSVYASFFTYRSRRDAVKGVDRHPVSFPCYHGHFAVHSDNYPEKAVAYEESFLLDLVQKTGFRLVCDLMYGTQDALILKRRSG